MVRYSAGEKKKRLILDACRKLFYQKGYTNTTYADICAEADIPQGSISYHFEGKQELGSIVRYELERETETYIRQLCGDVHNEDVLSAVQIFHFWQRFFDDKQLRRFVVEVHPVIVPDDRAWAAVSRLFVRTIERRNIEIDNAKFNFIVCAQIGLSEKLFSLVAQNIEEYSFYEVACFEISFFFRMLEFSDREIRKLIEEGWKVFKKLPIDPRHYENFQYTDYFDEIMGKPQDIRYSMLR